MKESHIRALFRTSGQAQSAAAVLAQTGGRLLASESRSVEVAFEEPRHGWLLPTLVSALILLLALATLTINGVGYVLASVALLTSIAVHPREQEHRLQVRDRVLAQGGMELVIAVPVDAATRLIRLLQHHQAIDITAKDLP
jgi:hypothetical protein